MARTRKDAAQPSRGDAGQQAGVVAADEVAANTETTALADGEQGAPDSAGQPGDAGDQMEPPSDDDAAVDQPAPQSDADQSELADSLDWEVSNGTLHDLRIERVFLPAGKTTAVTFPNDKRLQSFKKQFQGHVEVNGLQELLTMKAI